jgi:endonuclease G, mitochondrial
VTAQSTGGVRRGIAAAILLAGLLDAAPAAAQTDSNDPETCADLWREIGLPTVSEDTDLEFVPVCHPGYLLAHNSRTKTPDWVIEHVTREVAEGTATRPGVKFQQEPNLPETAAGAVDRDYAGSGFDRGHQAPSADFKSSADLMADTFFLSNVVPQEGRGFNQNIWRKLEDLVRKLAISRGELYVITGPIYQEPRIVHVSADVDACGNDIELRPLGMQTIGDSRVAVPAALFKILYDPRMGRLNAYVLPNVDHRGRQSRRRDLDYLETYRVGLDTVEQLTGWRFFTAFDDRTLTLEAEECAATMLH